MPTRAARHRGRAGVAGGGLRLSIPLRAGDRAAEIMVEPGHCERLFRMAAYVAIRDGHLAPGKRVFARLVPGQVRERHHDDPHHREVYCLGFCCVELIGPRGGLVAYVEFPREVFAAFAAARAVYLLAGAGQPNETPTIAYSVHAVDDSAAPFAVQIPALPAMSVAALAAAAVARGSPLDDWVVTFVSAEVEAGIEEIDRLSRAQGVEVAGRICTQVAFDVERRCFVRILDRLVISRATRATALSVVSTAASWGDFLGLAGTNGPQALASVHTHLHLHDAGGGSDGAPGDHLLASAGALRANGAPCISIDDIVTHYTAFPDPLSAAVIVSLFPGARGRLVTLYGYSPGAQLREEPGHWVLADGDRDAAAENGGR